MRKYLILQDHKKKKKKKFGEKMEMTEITLQRTVKKIKLETSYINICNLQVIPTRDVTEG